MSAGKILIIGCGNTMRTDDGVGPWVAMAVALWGLDAVESMAVHQLTPELADPIARARLAIFVDAKPAEARGSVEVAELEPSDAPVYSGHLSDPRLILTLARLVFGQSPRGWLVTVPATDFSIGEGLSSTARLGAAEALRRIADLIDREAAIEPGPSTTGRPA